MTIVSSAPAKPTSAVSGDEPAAMSGAAGALPRTAVRCRPIKGDDIEPVVILLARSFPTRDRQYWQAALTRLKQHTDAQGFPHFGFVLEAGEVLVGALLLIFSRSGSEAEPRVRCNLSSWCVDPRFGSYAPMLVKIATRDRSVTFVNISPEWSTRPMVEAQGFTRYADGLFLSVPLLSRPGEHAVLQGPESVPPGATQADRALMAGHADFACLRAWCVAGTQVFPLLFVRVSHVRGFVSAAHVVYVPDPALLSRFAFPIGRFLAKQGIFLLAIDSEGRLPGMAGTFLVDRMPKYFKGPHRPGFGDLAFTELPMFGP